MELSFIGNTVMTAIEEATDSIIIARDYSKFPGPRYIWQGPRSGEDFYNKVLLPKFEQILENKGVLLVDLDGTAGYITSFLEESIGGLARLFGRNAVHTHLAIKTDEEPYLLDEIITFINKVPRP